MRAGLWVAGALLALGCVTTPEGGAAPLVPGEVLVGTEDAVGPDAVVALVKQPGFVAVHGGSVSATSHLVRFTRADGTALDAAATEALVAALGKLPGVRFAEPNRLREPRTPDGGK